MRMNRQTLFASLLTLLALPGGVIAQPIVELQPRDHLSVRIDSQVAFDSETGLYSYAYVVRNHATSEQPVRFFALEFDSVIVNDVSPDGWTAGVHTDRPVISWAATGIGDLPPDYVDDGNVPPSPFSIEPGDTLAGFSFQSPAPPGNTRFYVQGDTPLPQVAGDAGELIAENATTDFTENSRQGYTVGPYMLNEDSVFNGGTERGVEGFLGFLGTKDRETHNAPAEVVVRFGVHGEAVDRSTFSASLNGRDVTALFTVVAGALDQKMATLDLELSPVRLGRNVLITSVRGIDPDSGDTVADVDRLVFFVDQDTLTR